MNSYSLDVSSSTGPSLTFVALGLGAMLHGVPTLAMPEKHALLENLPRISEENSSGPGPYGTYWNQLIDLRSVGVSPRFGVSETADVGRLVEAVRAIFADATFVTEEFSDPDEGWTKTVMHVATGVEDFGERAEVEDKFYEMVDGDNDLRDCLRKVVVSFE